MCALWYNEVIDRVRAISTCKHNRHIEILSTKYRNALITENSDRLKSDRGFPTIPRHCYGLSVFRAVSKKIISYAACLIPKSRDRERTRTAIYSPKLAAQSTQEGWTANSLILRAKYYRYNYNFSEHSHKLINCLLANLWYIVFIVLNLEVPRLHMNDTP